MAFLAIAKPAPFRAVSIPLAARFALAVAVALSAVQSPRAQTNKILRYWTAADGFSETYFPGVRFNPSGRLFTNHGLFEYSVFDGYRIESAPVPVNFAPVMESPDGALWTYAWVEWTRRIDGLWEFADGEWIKHELVLGDLYNVVDFTISFSSAKHMIPLNNRRALVLTGDRLIRFDAETQKTEVLLTEGETPIGGFNGMIPSSGEGIWIGGRRGAIQYELPASEPEAGAAIRAYPFGDAFPSEYFIPSVEHDGALYGISKSLETHKGIVLKFGGDWEIARANPEHDMRSGWAGGGGLIWFLDNGLYCAGPGGVLPVREDRYEWSGSPNALSFESGDAFWLGSDKGLVRAAPALWVQPLDLLGGNLECRGFFTAFDGTTWILRHTAIEKISEAGNETFAFPAGFECNRFVWDNASNYRAETPDGRFLLKTQNGALWFDPQSGLFEPLRHPMGRAVAGFHQGPSGKLWFVTRGGEMQHRLERYRGGAFEILHEFLDEWEFPILTLQETSVGDLWLKTSREFGVFRDGSLRIIGKSEEYPYYGAECMNEMDNGELWFGERAGHIVRYDGENFAEIPNPARESVHSIFQRRDGSVWVTAGSEILQYRGDYWIVHSDTEGLPFHRVHELMEDARGRLWARTMHAVYMHNPSADADPPDTYLLNPENLQETPLGKNAQIAFSGMDKWKYTLTENLLYSHSLDGGPWSPYSPKTIAILAGLSPGRHMFSVRALDRNGNADPTPAMVNFSVLLPWHRQPAFIGLAAGGVFIIFSLLSLLIARYVKLESLVDERTRNLNKTNLTLHREIRERKRLEREVLSIGDREKSRIGQDLHDSLCQKLAGIGFIAEALGESMGERGLPESGQVEKIAGLVNDSITQARGLARGLCPIELRNSNIEAALLELSSNLRELFGVHCSLRCSGPVETIGADAKVQLFRIAQEAANNAIKHGKATRIDIRLRKDGGALSLAVDDNGAGLRRGNGRSEGMGIRIMRYRADLIGASAAVTGAPGGGARVTCESANGDGASAEAPPKENG